MEKCKNRFNNFKILYDIEEYRLCGFKNGNSISDLDSKKRDRFKHKPYIITYS